MPRGRTVKVPPVELNNREKADVCAARALDMLVQRAIEMGLVTHRMDSYSEGMTHALQEKFYAECREVLTFLKVTGLE